MDQSTQFNLDLIRRYDKTGPRYTSYPTAVDLTKRNIVVKLPSQISAVGHCPCIYIYRSAIRCVISVPVTRPSPKTANAPRHIWITCIRKNSVNIPKSFKLVTELKLTCNHTL